MKILSNDNKIAEIFNNFFSDIIKTLKEKCKKRNIFYFLHATLEEVFKEIKKVDASKATQETDIPTRTVKENVDIFANFIFQNFNNMTATSIFPVALKLANITPVFIKTS